MNLKCKSQGRTNHGILLLYPRFFHTIGRKDDDHCKFSDAEILTTALLAARYFYGNLHSAGICMKEYRGVKRIGAFPAAVCDNIRIRRSHLLKGEGYRGKMQSERRYFYGFKVQVITTKAGLPIQFTCTPAPLPI